MTPKTKLWLASGLLTYAALVTLIPVPARTAPPARQRGRQYTNPVLDPVDTMFALTPTRQWREVVPTETILPDPTMSHGDNALWLMAHPWVPYIIHGTVIETTAVASGPATGTRCRFKVLESFKGNAPEFVEAMSWGGELPDQAAVYYHLPRCELGEEVVTALMDVRGELWLYGSESMYAVIQSGDDTEPRPWGVAVRDFFASVQKGGAQ